MGSKKTTTTKQGGAAAVQVALRIRPMNPQERSSKKAQCLNLKNEQTIELVDPKTDMKRTFQYNYCYGDADKEYHDAGRPKKAQENGDAKDEEKLRMRDASQKAQEKIYNDLGIQVIDNAFDAFNTCIFAYGQTGSGKTYTTFGDEETPGIVPRICQGLFSRIAEQQEEEDKDDDALSLDDIKVEEDGEESPNSKDEFEIEQKISIEYKITCSMVELYNEKFYDLLGKGEKEALPLRDDPKRGPFIEGLTIHVANNEKDILKLIQRGNKKKIMASTNSNSRSSRSHTLFQLEFTQTRVVEYPNDRPRKFQKKSRINLVDLAGSERVAKTGTTGTRFKEGVQINLSLSALGTVINALSENSRRRRRKLYVNYRASKLTHLMRDSLGGNSKTIMIATVSPAAMHFGETRSTLLFATRANAIINRGVKVNEEDDLRKMLMERNQTIAELRVELKEMKMLIEDQQYAKPSSPPRTVMDTSAIEELEKKVKRMKKENERLKDISDTFHGHEMVQYFNATGFSRPTAPHLIYLYTDTFVPMMQESDEASTTLHNENDSPGSTQTPSQLSQQEEDDETVDFKLESELDDEDESNKHPIRAIYTFKSNVTNLGTDYDAENDVILPIVQGFAEQYGAFPLRCACKMEVKGNSATLSPQQDINNFTNIVYINGNTILVEQALQLGDHVQLGGHHFQFMDGTDEHVHQVYYPPLRNVPEFHPSIYHYQRPFTTPAVGSPTSPHLSFSMTEEEQKALYQQFTTDMEESHDRRLQDVELRYQQALMRAESDRDRALIEVEQAKVVAARASFHVSKRATAREDALKQELEGLRDKLTRERNKSIWSRFYSKIKHGFKGKKRDDSDESESDDEEWDNYEVVEE